MEQLTEFVSKSFTSDRLPLSNIVTSATTSPPASVTSSITPSTPSTIPSNLFPSNFSSFSLFRNHPAHSNFSFPSSALHSMVDRLSSGGHPHFPPLHFFASSGSPFHPSHFARGSNFPPVDLSLGTSAAFHQKMTNSAIPARDRSRSPSSQCNSRTSLTDGDSRQSLDPDGFSAEESDADAPSSPSGRNSWNLNCRGLHFRSSFFLWTLSWLRVNSRWESSYSCKQEGWNMYWLKELSLTLIMIRDGETCSPDHWVPNQGRNFGKIGPEHVLCSFPPSRLQFSSFRYCNCTKLQL